MPLRTFRIFRTHRSNRDSSWLRALLALALGLACLGGSPVTALRAGELPSAALPFSPPDLRLRSSTVPLRQLRNLRGLLPPQAARPLPVAVDASGVQRPFRPGVVLVRWRETPEPGAILVPAGSERVVLEKLQASGTVAHCELDFVLSRQFVPNDPEITQQWHHQTLHSASAWAMTRGNRSVSIAILDTPFQMTHPDLEANAVPGWSILSGSPISGVSEGFYHSTITAGLAAAVIDNGIGVSGIGHFSILPVDIGDEPTISDMDQAIRWAADHGVRVVNLSWDGAFSAVLNDAGVYLRQRSRGMLFMAGVNGRRPLSYPSHPFIYAVAMTDRWDAPRSAFGNHIDFAAPGFDIYSTTTNSTYEVDSGTSFSTPLAAAAAAWVMTLNPTLDPPAIEEILRQGSIDLGDPGWDQTFGWGRIDLAKIAAATFATLPLSRVEARLEPDLVLSTGWIAGAGYSLQRAIAADQPWATLLAPLVSTNGGRIEFRDPDPPSGLGFYRIEIRLP